MYASRVSFEERIVLFLRALTVDSCQGESNFDELAKLCFQDVMNGVPQWEAGAVEGKLHV